MTAFTDETQSLLSFGWSVTSCPQTGRIDLQEFRDDVLVWSDYCSHLPCAQELSQSGIMCIAPGKHTIKMKFWADTRSCDGAVSYCEAETSYNVEHVQKAIPGDPGPGFIDSFNNLTYNVPLHLDFKNVWNHEFGITTIPTEEQPLTTGNWTNTLLWTGDVILNISPSGAPLAESWTRTCDGWKRGSVIGFPDLASRSCADHFGKPIRVTTGNMRYEESVPLPPMAGLSLPLIYDHQRTQSGLAGTGWRSPFDSWMKTRLEPDGSTLVSIGTEREILVFAVTDGVWSQLWPTAGATAAIIRYDGASATYMVREPGTDIENYYRVSDGRIVMRRSATTGRAALFTYDSNGRPARVEDSWTGTGWNLTLDAAGRIESISVDGSSIEWNYAYDASGRLLSIMLGSTPWRTFTYDASGMTEARDAAGNLIESHQYSNGAATTSLGPDGDVTGATYDGTGRVPGESVTHVTWGAGSATDYYSRFIAGQRHTVQVKGVCGACGTKDVVYGFDSAGHLVREQSARGYVTVSTYDASGHVTSRSGPYAPAGCNPDTDSNHCRLDPDTILTANLASFPVTSTTSYTYADPHWPDRATLISTESVLHAGGARTEAFMFDVASGATLQHILTGYTGSPAVQASRTTTTTLYDGVEGAVFDPGGAFESSWLALPQPAMLRKSIDGPRADVTDVTQFVYYPVDAAVPPEWRGQLAATRNAAGHINRYENYDLFGQAERTIDPNGVVTEMTHDSLGRVLTSTLKGVPGCDTSVDPLCESDLTTINTYYLDAGPLASQTDANGNVTTYEYDARGRLAALSRGPSATDPHERIEYTYDAATGKQSHVRNLGMTGGAWIETKSDSFTYDSEARLTQIIRPDLTSVGYSYNLAGNVTGARDENHAAENTFYLYDAAGSLSVVTQTLGSGTVSTSYTHDAKGNLTSVTDPNGNITSYTFDDFGEMLSQNSPVTGTTTYAYNEAGNLTSSTDANGATTTRAYDELGRELTSVSTRAGLPPESVTFTYDEDVCGTGNAIGRRSTMDDGFYCYDRRGMLISETQLYTTGYRYDGNGNRTSIIYPSGRTATYAYDFANRPASLSIDGTTAIAAASYAPFGPRTQIVFGNGTTKTMTFNQRYHPLENRLTGPGGTIADYTYAHDAAGNITQIHDAISPAYNRDFAYDDLNRLTTANSGTSLWGNGGYVYDAMGNMLSSTLGSRSTNFAYDGTTPKLASVNEATVTYDAAGNETSTGTYTARNLFLGPPDSNDGWGMLSYDGRGVRIGKVTRSGIMGPLTETGYVYSPELHLIAIAEPAANTVQGIFGLGTEYFWFGDEPVAALSTRPDATPRFTFTDHLGTPILQTGTDATVTWRAEFEPFGSLFVQRTNDTQEPYAQPLGFPGQERDAIGDLSYNIFRWYRSGWGRYTQADPIGLLGGINEYVYVDDRPLSLIDPTGLQYTRVPTPEEFEERKQRSCARDAFLRNYQDMRKANWKLSDKYFHCKANCEATRCGKYGEDEACDLGNFREWSDQLFGESAADAAADQAANRFGRGQAKKYPNKSCGMVCSSLRPKGLPSQY